MPLGILLTVESAGMIDAEEMGLAMQALGFEASKSEIEKMVREMDKDGDSTVDLEEFMLLMEEKMNSKDGKAELMKGHSRMPPSLSCRQFAHFVSPV